MSAQKKGPAERANAHGAVFAATPIKGNRMFDSTACCIPHKGRRIPYPRPAYYAAIEAGIASAHAWLADPKQSLSDHRGYARVEYIGTVIDASEPGHVPLTAAIDGFDDGFSRGIAQIIAGGARHG